MTGLENPTHILFVLIVAVLVLGPKRLPEVGRSLGAGIRGFKDSLSGSDEDEEKHDS
jgi:sec-independent protein translocase protein TatA